MSRESRRSDHGEIDRLTYSRAQHLKNHDTRLKSSSEEEINSISDWSESDRECCPLSDFESTSNVDEIIVNKHYDMPFIDGDDEVDPELSREPTFLENILRFGESPLPIIHETIQISPTSYIKNTGKDKQPIIHERMPNIISRKSSIHSNDKQFQQPLLPARRIQNRQMSPRRSIVNPHVLPPTVTVTRAQRRTNPLNSSKLCLNRETTSTSINLTTQPVSDATSSPNSSFHSNDEHYNQQRQLPSPNFSQTSMMNSFVPRVYEIKKIFVDDYDYGRLTDVSTIKAIPPRNRQKWGTIVHPPFPLGYQHITPERVTQSVQRLSSPVRCRDRHTPIQTPSKRYLSVEETDALINRLTKTKPTRPTDQYWSGQRQSQPLKNLSNTLKPNTNWKGVGVSA